MGWFNKKKKDAAKQEKQMEQQKVRMLQNIATITRLAKSGLIFIDVKEHKVVISTTLSTLFLTDRQKWMNFLNNVQMWFVYKASQLAWNKIFLDEEVKAVREAREKYPLLTKLQEADIRMKARSAINVDAVHVPKIEPYDFILSTDIKDGSEPDIFAVGRYENGEFDMVTFEEVNQKANQSV